MWWTVTSGARGSAHAAFADRAPVQRQVRRLLLVLVAAWAMEMVASYAQNFWGMASQTRETFAFAAIVILAAGTVYVHARVQSLPYIRLAVLSGVVFLLLSQTLGTIGEYSFAQAYPVLGKGTAVHQYLEHAFFVSGCLFLMGGCYVALFENQRVSEQREADRARLAESLALREKAESALKNAHDALEREVAARTAELEERNAQLNAELADRRRFEVSLANKLHYEEGLAACSHILLADTEPEEALKRALEQLLSASRAARVYLFENVEDAEGGLRAVLTHEVWEKRRCPRRAFHEENGQTACSWCEPSCGRTLWYSRGLSRWQRELSEGTPIAGTASSLPDAERRFIESSGARSILLLPVGWEGRWRGFLGFEDTIAAREWTQDEVRLLRTAAEMVSACKERQHAEEALREAYDQLEMRVDERTAELRRANDELQQALLDRRRAEVDKQKLETQLRQAQKMQAIGTLAGGIAHDFNNILASILGYAELALRRMDSGNPFMRYFEEVLNAGNRARELVRQILLFSRQSDIERHPVRLNHIATEVAALIRASCPASVSISLHVERQAITVLGDAVQLHQVLLNLCTNALYAMKKTGGTLDIRLETIEIDQELSTSHGRLLPGNYALLAVADSGEGMDPGTMERIFEPFFTTKSVSEGTGMGLAIVHGIVTGLGGAVTVQSVLGQGSIFHIYLPLHTSREESLPAPKVEAARGKERILVVDDEPQLVALWTELLGQFGYEVTGFSNSVRAWERFRANPGAFDIALLDQTMPGITGAELARNILRTRPDFPIIIATGFSEAMSPEIARSIGVRELVYKPILGQDLSAAIRRALESPSEPSPEGEDSPLLGSRHAPSEPAFQPY